MEQPTVSIIIPTYNRAHLLPRALGSVAAQEVHGVEVILVDDGSTDGTSDLVPTFPVPVRYVRQRNRGPSAARNHGLREARGELIAFLDSDDEWPPGSLRSRIECLRAHPDVDLVFGDLVNVRRGAPEGPTLFATRAFFGPMVANRRDPIFLRRPRDLLLLEPFIQTSTVVLRAAALGDDGFDESIWVGEDWELWLRLGERVNFVALPVITVHRHLQGDNLTDPSLEELRSEVIFWTRWTDRLPPASPAGRLARDRLAAALFDSAHGELHLGGNAAEARQSLHRLLRLRRLPAHARLWLRSWLPSPAA